MWSKSFGTVYCSAPVKGPGRADLVNFPDPNVIMISREGKV